jgi:hemoglobin
VIIEYVRYRIAESAAEEFVDAYRRAASSLERSLFCLHYELARCSEEPECFILRLQWTSLEDHMSKFRQSAEFREFLKSIGPYVDRIEEMRHYEVTDVTTKTTPGHAPDSAAGVPKWQR